MEKRRGAEKAMVESYGLAVCMSFSSLAVPEPQQTLFDIQV
jgi:hypothetical protein